MDYHLDKHKTSDSNEKFTIEVEKPTASLDTEVEIPAQNDTKEEFSVENVISRLQQLHLQEMSDSPNMMMEVRPGPNLNFPITEDIWSKVSSGTKESIKQTLLSNIKDLTDEKLLRKVESLISQLYLLEHMSVGWPTLVPTLANLLEDQNVQIASYAMVVICGTFKYLTERKKWDYANSHIILQAILRGICSGESNLLLYLKTLDLLYLSMEYLGSSLCDAQVRELIIEKLTEESESKVEVVRKFSELALIRMTEFYHRNLQKDILGFWKAASELTENEERPKESGGLSGFLEPKSKKIAKGHK